MWTEGDPRNMKEENICQIGYKYIYEHIYQQKTENYFKLIFQQFVTTVFQ